MRIHIIVEDVPTNIDAEVLEQLVALQLRQWRTWVHGLALPSITGPTNHDDAKRERWIRGKV